MIEDTIAAISTAYGEGGIGIIRISGSEALPLLEKIFKPAAAGEEEETKDPNTPSRMMRYGHITDPENGTRIDECMAVFLRGPKTYTTEDMAEIYCHGSVVALRNTLALSLRQGARLAEPGEFTKRAFLNGRIDLSQAEAVMDMVRAKTDSGYDMAMTQLEGALSLRVGELRKQLLDLLVEITVNIDYPDEDIEEITLQKVEEQTSLIGDSIAELVENSTTGRMLREGISLAIAGRPNVGKSSLMNALLGEDRAIVTDIPGTTRDTIEEGASIRGIPVIITDTAGIHETRDQVEVLGIERSRKAFDKADCIILMIDGSRDLTSEDEVLLEEFKVGADRALLMVLINKSDLDRKVTDEDVRRVLPGADIIHTSMRRGDGLEEIADRIETLVYEGKLFQKDSLLVSNVRHIELLRQAAEDLVRAKAMAARGEVLDLIEIDVKAAYDSLGEIIGETVSDEVLTEVFSRFCLGK